ncbi:MAG TPA: hypothetical protein VGP80_06830 [Gemmatimonadales bacterium]|nr:hypothetical protein [Gemmatimonadales bacterium]
MCQVLYSTKPIPVPWCRRKPISRAFVNEDSGGPDPRHRFPLPPRGDPEYDAAATRALLQGANEGDSASAEEATGYRFGEPALVPYVRAILERARKEKNDRLEQLAERFLTRAGVEIDDD